MKTSKINSHHRGSTKARYLRHTIACEGVEFLCQKQLFFRIKDVLQYGEITRLHGFTTQGWTELGVYYCTGQVIGCDGVDSEWLCEACLEGHVVERKTSSQEVNIVAIR